MNMTKFLNLSKDEDCTGCLACVNSCQNNALIISVNDEGFYRPQIIEEKCTRCGMCERSCPLLHPIVKAKYTPKVWAAWNKDQEVRINSSSGGVFSALAIQMLKDDGVVFGAAYDEHLKVYHRAINNVEDLKILRKSKYIQSYIGKVMKEVKDNLCNGINVLFVGTPCQCAALKSFLRKPYDNLLLVDFICHGVPSPLFFEQYKKWLEDALQEKIADINFRGKPKGWYDALRIIKTASGKQRCLKGHKDCYWVGYNNNNNNLQNSCYNCQFLGFPRVSDITIADFWGIGKKKPFKAKKSIKKGVSMVVANSNHGLKAIEDNLYLELFERSLDEAISANQSAVKSCVRPISRNTIYQDLQIMKFNDFSKKYLIPSKKTIMVKMWRENFPAFLVSGLRQLSMK